MVISSILGNDDVESTLAEGNMGKESQKFLKVLKQLWSIEFPFSNYNRVDLFQIPIIDVEQRPCTSASHLRGSDIDQTFVEK